MVPGRGYWKPGHYNIDSTSLKHCYIRLDASQDAQTELISWLSPLGSVFDVTTWQAIHQIIAANCYKYASAIFSSMVVNNTNHYNDVIIGATASQITSLTIVYSTVYSDAYRRKHQSSASLAFVLAGEFPAQMASCAENVSIWWRHNVHNSTTAKPTVDQCCRFLNRTWMWKFVSLHPIVVWLLNNHFQIITHMMILQQVITSDQTRLV